MSRADELHRRLVRNIKALARRRGITLSHLPDRAGVARSFYWRVLAGDGAPTIDWLAAIAVALDVDAGELLAPPSPGAARAVSLATEKRASRTRPSRKR